MSENKSNDSAVTKDSGQEKNLSSAKAPDSISPKPESPVTIAVSSRSLFNMAAENTIYVEEGLETYVAYQVEHENDPPKPGPAFPFVKALMNVNSRLKELYPDSKELFDIVLVTSNHAQVGVRLINSITHYELAIKRFCMTGETSPTGYLKAYKTNLYLSKNKDKVEDAIKEGIAAATMFEPETFEGLSETQLRLAFDGDAVLFSDESECPFKDFLEALGNLQRKFYAKNERSNCPIRTFLVTARSADSAGARVLNTLRSWGLEINEPVFLSGAPKGPLLQKIKPHIFFDDQMRP